jgi:hypothetical protein
MAAPQSQPKPLGLSVLIGIVIGVLAAILSSHVAVWLMAGIFVGVAAGASIGRKPCPRCGAGEQAGANHRAVSRVPGASIPPPA